MSRRPVDQIARSRDAEGRQVIWETIRAQPGPFVMGDLFRETWISRATLRSYLRALTAAGILERTEHPERVGLRDAVTWRLLQDEGHYAPRVNNKGERVTQGLGVEQMWRTMRMLKEFTSPQVAMHATTDEVQVSELTARSYCSMLLATGYLRCIQKGSGNRRATYRLVRNTGPLAPQIQRVKQVFDPNSKAVYRRGEDA